MTKTVLGCISLAVFLSSCASAPLWTTKGPGAYEKCKDILCADGLAEPKHGDLGIASKTLREETAERRARARILEILESRITLVMKDYVGPEGELVERAIRTIANGATSGAVLLDRHTDGDESVRALVGIDSAKFKKAVEDIPQLQEESRKFLRQRTDALLEEAESN
ncbi:MAG: hypothetical protein ABIG11_07935 [bacterium]